MATRVLDLVICASPRPSLPARPSSVLLLRQELGFLTKPAVGLRISRNHRRIAPAVGSSSEAAAKERIARRGTVVSEVQDPATEVPDVTKETWQSLVMECTKPVLIEFWAPWCGPCRVAHPMIAKLAKTYEGKLDCFKLNTDECPDLASQYGVKSIPTIIMLKNGEKKDAVIGAVPESTLVTCIEKFLER